MKKLHIILLSNICFLFADTDHLVFSRITVRPDNAELISIKNPTPESISLDNYYISDSPNYYKIQTENDLSPGHLMSDFLVKFPESASIAADDSILISIQSNYTSYYGDNFVVDFTLRDDLIETESGSAGLARRQRFDGACRRQWGGGMRARDVLRRGEVLRQHPSGAWRARAGGDPRG